jgi:hypothetical protein
MVSTYDVAQEKGFRREPAMNGNPAQDYFLFIRLQRAADA